MWMTHAFTYANFNPFLSLEVVLHVITFSIYICKSLQIIANAGMTTVSLLTHDGDIRQ